MKLIVGLGKMCIRDSTDTDYYTGSNIVNKRAIKSKKIPAVNKENSILVDIAPFSGMIFELRRK